MTSPRVSVVIASLVGAPFIVDCIASLERQAAALGGVLYRIQQFAASLARGRTARLEWSRHRLHSRRTAEIPGVLERWILGGGIASAIDGWRREVPRGAGNAGAPSRAFRLRLL